jgi:hypothetical protein
MSRSDSAGACPDDAEQPQLVEVMTGQARQDVVAPAGRRHEVARDDGVPRGPELAGEQAEPADVPVILRERDGGLEKNPPVFSVLVRADQE